MTRSSPLPARRLIEPDVWTCPHGKRVRPQAVETFGPEVADLNAKAGFAPDPQQELILDLVFAFRPDGSPASFETCIVCCRQNLKTGVLKQIVLGWLYVLEESEIVWSAHEMSTTLSAQDDLANLIRESPDLRRRMLVQKNDGVYADNGSERIELATGQSVLFKARTKTGGRGLSKKKLILDEAFALTPRIMGSLIPTMLAMTDPQVVYASSPGMHDSASLLDIRERGVAGSTPMMTYVEWNSPRTECEDPDCRHPKSGDPACALNRPSLWTKANPTVSTGRITLEKIANTRQALSAEEFMRECLGWWEDGDTASGLPVVELRTWSELGDKDLTAPARAALVIDVEPKRTRSAIGLVGATTDAKTGEQVDLLMTRVLAGTAGTAAAVRKLLERADLDVLEVALHPSNQAGALLPAIKAAIAAAAEATGQDPVPLRQLTHHDVARGCATVQTAVIEGRVRHLKQPELTGAATTARTRYVNQAEVWDRRTLEFAPFVAVASALQRWDELSAVPVTPPPSPRRAGRRVASGSIAAAGF